MNEANLESVSNEFDGKLSFKEKLKVKWRTIKKIYKAKRFIVVFFEIDKQNNMICVTENFNTFRGAGDILLTVGSEMNKWDNHDLAIKNQVNPGAPMEIVDQLPPCKLHQCDGMVYPCENGNCQWHSCNN